MTLIHRLNLLTFGQFTWCVSMFTAAEHPGPLLSVVAAIQAGLGAGVFATGLLPGRTARFL